MEKSEETSRNKHDKLSECDGLEEICCSICMEPWTPQGDHQVCCLPCGHAYGFSCIKRWHRFSGRLASQCPQCNCPFGFKEVRKIYTSLTFLPDEELLKKKKKEELQARVTAEQNARKATLQKLDREKKKYCTDLSKLQNQLRNVTRERQKLFRRLTAMDLLLVPLKEHLNMVEKSGTSALQSISSEIKEQRTEILERIQQIESRACIAEDQVFQLEAQLMEQRACIAVARAHISSSWHDGNPFSGSKTKGSKKCVSLHEVLRLLSSIKKGDLSMLKQMEFKWDYLPGLCEDEAPPNAPKRPKVRYNL
ncbi:hypothetical protein Pfo_027169 [Paulownia fortunei]|nr:hypothetical protein Pfo_027169 [Paulownia fortunei]